LVWVREMTEDEIRQVGETEPTIDSIEVAEFESHAALNEWLSKKSSSVLHARTTMSLTVRNDFLCRKETLDRRIAIAAFQCLA
jgi:hypothetical protein